MSVAVRAGASACAATSVSSAGRLLDRDRRAVSELDEQSALALVHLHDADLLELLARSRGTSRRRSVRSENVESSCSSVLLSRPSCGETSRSDSTFERARHERDRLLDRRAIARRDCAARCRRLRGAPLETPGRFS